MVEFRRGGIAKKNSKDFRKGRNLFKQPMTQLDSGVGEAGVCSGGAMKRVEISPLSSGFM